jgi:hypothetical protein
MTARREPTEQERADYIELRTQARGLIERMNAILAATGHPNRIRLQAYQVQPCDFDDFADDPPDDGDPRYVPEVAASREDEAGL